ncbi:MAG: PQQ-binding-like beta-propeller repeat protein [Anaerolineales bacterium]|jgi:nucleoside phosphorylase/outer membrane protein assembly factor BamB|nr:PQQ-binding-like beta-propeller repeat protein [Anaerolineales bacterium]
MDLILFCPDCHRYLGRSDSCLFCGWVRPFNARLPQPGVPLWELPGGEAPRCPPVIAGETAYLNVPGKGLLAAGVADGALHWVFPYSAHLNSTLCIAHGRIYLSARSGGLLALQPDPAAPEGVRLAWQHPLPGQAGNLALAGRDLWIGDGEGRLHQLRDAGDHPEQLRTIPTVYPVHASPFLHARQLLAVTSHHRGLLLALDAERGDELWRREINARGRWLLPLGRRPGRSEAALVVTDQGLLMAYSLPEGDPLGWQVAAPGGVRAQPLPDGAALLVGSGAGQIMRLNWSSGACEVLAELDGAVVGLALWRGLLFTAALPGWLYILDASTGAVQHQLELPGGASGGIAVSQDGSMIVGQRDGSYGSWRAYPWHLGAYAWAADRAECWKEPAQAALFHALAGQKEAAAQDWLRAGQPELAARFWDALGYDEQAAQTYLQAAELCEATFPARAAAHLNRAADHYELAEQPTEAGRLRKRAARMGKYPHLRLEAITTLVSEAGMLACFAVRVRNRGNAAASEIVFRLGGPLAHLVTFGLQEALPAGAEAVLEFDQLIPTQVGQSKLLVALTYKDPFGAIIAEDEFFDMQISPPPPGVITFEDDIGLVHVRIPEGSPLPVVRSKEGVMVGTIEYEIIQRTTEKDGNVAPTKVEVAPPSILLVTATDVEAQAVLQTFARVPGQPIARNVFGEKIFYPLGQFGGAELWMVQSEMGTATPGGALLTIRNAIQHLHPRAVIMVGIAFGTDMQWQTLGDVLVAQRVACYEPGNQAGRFIPRGDRVTASTTLLDKFHSGKLDWEGAPVHFGLVLSGEKLINDLDFRHELLEHEPEAIGGEMEGAGLYAAAQDGQVDWLLVKGISDFADGERHREYQPRAAANAAAYVRHVLERCGWLEGGEHG